MGATNILQKKVIIAIDAMLFCFDLTQLFADALDQFIKVIAMRRYQDTPRVKCNS